ncbi:T-cell surface glycoprotein CD1b-like isoform X4 [Lemur catta]|uniref:T-cell surface glycoprotein CD1b-like isoform X4 n=1 Tax=Lemur catta TaxID=9447 RepID=UPI001E26C86F|nr:T-cell surface glycoprotein CD1b-like isoform X4 [Lemur catta]
MLILPFQLLAVLFPGGDSEDAFHGPTSFHVIQILSFANSTWKHNRGSGWLDDLQIHGWDSHLGTAVLLKPWSKGNFSDEEFAELEKIFRAHFHRFTQHIRGSDSQFQLKYPFEIQAIAGCELRSGGSTVSFFREAIGGLDFLNFEKDTCVPAPEGGSRAQHVCKLIIQYPAAINNVMKLLFDFCLQYLLGFLDAAKAELQRQVTLDVAAWEAAGLSCRVKHSSLEGQDIILHWGHPISIGLIFFTIIVPSLILLLCLALWYKRRWKFQDNP